MSFLSSAPIATLLPFLIAAVAILPAAAIGPQSNEGTDKKEDKQTPVLACSLTSPELRERIVRVRRDLVPHVIETAELPNGFALRVPNEDGQIQRLAEIVALESQCCAFLDFEIRLDAGSRVISLHLTGPEGAQEVLRAMAESFGDL